ncbi:MAG TPA: formate hydrogenlyase, partial [Nitrospira sp.]|nr:formate hydrogenlyase [Nitrospira sp.]
MLHTIALIVTQTAVLLAFSPFLIGLIRKVKARLQ